jgi:imidazole glycerol-phosphate synthase subunit HisH
MIAIIDYGMGNLYSVKHALDYLGADCKITRSKDDLLASDKLILPGVGSFKHAMANINQFGLVETLNKCVLEMKKPIIGICLGMQLLSEEGEEDGLTKGLGWINGRAIKLKNGNGLPVPHIGFNTVHFVSSPYNLFDGLDSQADFYFVHSYQMECTSSKDISGWCNYGEKFVASVQRQNIWGTQFHPEKSQTNGLRVLNNFMKLAGS